MPILETRSGQDHRYSDPMMVHDTSSSQDACTHKFRIPISSNTKDIPDTIFLKTRSTIKVKVTVTQKWYMTYHHPYSKFGIPTSKNIEDMHHSIPILETRPEVKVTVTRKCYVTLSYPKMHSHTKFGIPTSKEICTRLNANSRD